MSQFLQPSPYWWIIRQFPIWGDYKQGINNHPYTYSPLHWCWIWVTSEIRFQTESCSNSNSSSPFCSELSCRGSKAGLQGPSAHTSRPVACKPGIFQSRTETSSKEAGHTMFLFQHEQTVETYLLSCSRYLIFIWQKSLTLPPVGRTSHIPSQLVHGCLLIIYFRKVLLEILGRAQSSVGGTTYGPQAASCRLRWNQLLWQIICLRT